MPTSCREATKRQLGQSGVAAACLSLSRNGQRSAEQFRVATFGMATNFIAANVGGEWLC